MHGFSDRALACGIAAVFALLLIAQPGKALDNVTLITDFGYNGRHAYFFVAIEKGYYKDADLDVKVVRGQGSVDAIRQVGANNAIVGFADAGSLVLARGNDQIPVKLIAIVYAKPPQAVFCREDSGIKRPSDLEGASIANPAGGATVDMFPVYAKAAGFDASKVKWIVAGSDSLPGLLASNRVPCVGQFTVGEPLLRMQAAPAVRGMKDAFARPDEAGRIMNKYHPAIDAGVAEGETKAVAELAEIKSHDLGRIDPAGIQETIDVVNSVFKLKAPVTVNDVYAPGFVAK
jgi:NitT/TauT family transport system substrate-binding protein